MHNLGCLFMLGNGVDFDLEEAITWLQQAFEKGCVASGILFFLKQYNTHHSQRKFDLPKAFPFIFAKKYMNIRSRSKK